MHHILKNRNQVQNYRKVWIFQSQGIKTDLWLLRHHGERGHEELFQAEGIVLYVDCGGGYMTIQ